jgi:hypothetical protein
MPIRTNSILLVSVSALAWLGLRCWPLVTTSPLIDGLVQISNDESGSPCCPSPVCLLGIEVRLTQPAWHGAAINFSVPTKIQRAAIPVLVVRLCMCGQMCASGLRCDLRCHVPAVTARPT